MKTISIDIETYSGYDLTKCGAYKYSEYPDFEILLFAYSVDGGEVQSVDIANGEEIPLEIIDALTDDNVLKWAHNANFERVCLSRYLRDMGISLDPFADNHHSVSALGKAKYLNPSSWRCSMIWAATLGLPLSLESVGEVLKLEKRKLAEGRRLIRKFCTPPKPTQLMLCTDTDWELFKEYNIRDVQVEMAIQHKLRKFPVPDSIWDEYCQDQEINDRGVTLDMTLVRNAIKADERSRAELMEKMKALTNLDNPNSVAQMKNWLADNGLETDTLGKKAVTELLKSAPKPLREVLSLRQSLAKSSTAKYTAMQNAVCSDGRARGMFQFYGASRTGRWAGRLIQMQNLPQNHLPDLETVRESVRNGNATTPDVLSELIRTAFVPKPGYKFIVADFSAIEARVIAWLAKETWRNEVFATHGKIYEASASEMFGVPIEKIDKGSPLRQKGKIAELALGYGGSVGALKSMGALEKGLAEDELQPIVNAWRAANQKIVSFWWAVDRAAMTAVRDKTFTETHGIKFHYESGMLFITLPSDRKLVYVKPQIGENRFGGDCVTYMGVGASKKWERIPFRDFFSEILVSVSSSCFLAVLYRSARTA